MAKTAGVKGVEGGAEVLPVAMKPLYIENGYIRNRNILDPANYGTSGLRTGARSGVVSISMRVSLGKVTSWPEVRKFW